MRLPQAVTGTTISGCGWQWRLPPRYRIGWRCLGAILLSCAALVCGASRSAALDGLDTRQLGLERQREVAARQLESARESVTLARAAVEASRRELDQFVARHFDALRSLETDPAPAKSRASAPSVAPSNAAGHTAAEQLRQQIEELTTRRDQLLGRLLPAHPEVVSIEGQIQEVSANLAVLVSQTTEAEGRSPGGPADSQDQVADPFNALRKQRQIAARLYDEHLERLNAAKQDLRDAVEAEQHAARRMAQIPSPSVKHPPIGLSSDQPATVSTPAPVPHPVPRKAEAPAGAQRGSQPLALVALVIALAVAALAAVKLARSTSDTLFASVEDIAAALALPVVGTFPMVENPRMVAAPPIRSLASWALAGQVTLAVLLFAAIAYCVQNPAGLWQTLAHPLESMGRVLSNLRGQ